ncbi:MAG: tRNA 2-thiouridine(34) synthase MnmA [Alphaproteobacteria bacterium]
MSGGVDSSVTAALLKEEGHQVVGVTLRLHGVGAASASAAPPGGRTCCGGSDIGDAKRVADHLGIPHHVLDFTSVFQSEVIDPFADAYVRGETPVPCVACNQTVKFRDLLAVTRRLGADALATGHYVRREDGCAGPELHRAVDHGRDQSYFLFATTREQLHHLRFPLGGMSKTETRRLADRLGLPVATKPDSQDICFVPEGDYGQLVRRLRPESQAVGEIVHVDGRVLGAHAGVAHYTVGQRRGLGIGGEAEPLYVVRLEADTRRVIVGPRSAAARECLWVNVVNWLGDGEGVPIEGLRVQVRLRSLHSPVAAEVFGRSDGVALVRLEAPFVGVAPGQACVFYQGERVLGGGWIRREECP